MSDANHHGTDPGREMTHEIPGLLRAVGVGALIGCVVAIVGVGGSLWLSGHSWTVALGIGGMAAVWGGLGFGSMFGGTLHLIRHEGDADPLIVVPAPSAAPPAASQGIRGVDGGRRWAVETEEAHDAVAS